MINNFFFKGPVLYSQTIFLHFCLFLSFHAFTPSHDSQSICDNVLKMGLNIVITDINCVFLTYLFKIAPSLVLFSFQISIFISNNRRIARFGEDDMLDGLSARNAAPSQGMLLYANQRRHQRRKPYFYDSRLRHYEHAWHSCPRFTLAV